MAKKLKTLSRWDVKFIEKLFREVPDWDASERRDLVARLRGTFALAEQAKRVGMN